jgi:hypothetical protein
MIAFPFNLQSTLIVAGASLVVGLYGGYKLTSNYYDAKVNKAKEAVIEQLAHQAALDRKTIEAYQIDKKTLQDAYISLGRKSRETKLTNTPCTLTAPASKLWNESLLGEAILPETPSGTIGTGTTDFAKGSSPREGKGIDFAAAFENKLLNDEICARNREKLEALKKWDKETYE